MGCVCPRGEEKKDKNKDKKKQKGQKGDNYKAVKDGEETTGAEQGPIFSKRAKEEDILVEKRVLTFEEMDWHDDMPRMIQGSNIGEMFQKIEGLLENSRNDSEMRKLLDKSKTDFELGVFAKLKKDKELGSIHTYYSTWTVPCTPEEFFYFNMFQDKPTRKKIDSSCEQFDILAAVEIDGILYLLVYLKMAKFMIIKGKESFYIKALKRVQDDENITKWVEINSSISHESVPLKDNYKRVNILESGIIYTYNKNLKTTHIEGYTHVIPQVSAGMLILKPVLGKYYKSYLKQTMEAIIKERAENKYNYEESMNKLLSGESIIYHDNA